MSIAILAQVYDEMRRLAIAGSVVAGGDFRLKKLIAPLEQAGAKAPVFAKVAESIKAVVDGKEHDAALLELTTLVNAILYTQAKTGIDGTLQPIETANLGAGAPQASARVLKPLLEALTSTGSGRMEIISDAYERGAFRDLRLVKPSLDAMDDVYGEIGEFVATRVLPLYGKAIIPELQAKLDLKGKTGDARRLRLLHALDPVGTRATIKQALDSGSKEIKVVAIECLGDDPADLSYLLEQATAKSQEVRQAAYRALSLIEEDAAIEVLQKAIAGHELDLAANAMVGSKSVKLLRYVIAEAERAVAALPKIKDKKDISKSLARIGSLLGCLSGRDDKEAESLVLKLFGKRDELAKIKGDVSSGADLNGMVARLMGNGSKKLQTTLAQGHAALSADELGIAFHGARQAAPAPDVFAMFSPYLTAKVDEKKKQRDPAWAKREAIAEAIGAGRHYQWANRDESGPPLDPRWLDVAVAIKHLGLIRQLGRPGHEGANAFLTEAFQAALKASKSLEECHEIVACMVYSGHPAATDAFVAAFDKHCKKASAAYNIYWFARLIPHLPPSATPRLEALVPSVGDKVADALLDQIQQLRDKTQAVPDGSIS